MPRAAAGRRGGVLRAVGRESASDVGTSIVALPRQGPHRRRAAAGPASRPSVEASLPASGTARVSTPGNARPSAPAESFSGSSRKGGWVAAIALAWFTADVPLHGSHAMAGEVNRAPAFFRSVGCFHTAAARVYCGVILIDPEELRRTRPA